MTTGVAGRPVLNIAQLNSELHLKFHSVILLFFLKHVGNYSELKFDSLKNMFTHVYYTSSLLRLGPKV